MRVLDTDTCGEILRGNDAVIDRRESIEDTVVTTWINACELLYGAAKSRHPDESRDGVIEFLATMPVIGMSAASATRFGRLKADLERSGKRLADADLLIASMTLAHRATLVTGKVKHYERIRALPIETWMPR